MKEQCSETASQRPLNAFDYCVGSSGPAIARIFAAEIEGAVIVQVRGLLRQPEVVLGAWGAARVRRRT